MIKKLVEKYKIKREKKKIYLSKLNELEDIYNKAQNYVDHEGKMRAYCDWDDSDHDNFKELCNERDIAYDNLIKHKNGKN